jgi:hypothetical protein
LLPSVESLVFLPLGRSGDVEGIGFGFGGGDGSLSVLSSVGVEVILIV